MLSAKTKVRLPRCDGAGLDAVHRFAAHRIDVSLQDDFGDEQTEGLLFPCAAA
jgi:hypothetical protein